MVNFVECFGYFCFVVGLFIYVWGCVFEVKVVDFCVIWEMFLELGFYELVFVGVYGWDEE